MNKKIIAGIILILIAIGIYITLHDISDLYIFHVLKLNDTLGLYKIYQCNANSFLKQFFFYFFMKNHLVDIFWFFSFCLIFTQIFPFNKYVQTFILILLALLSELSQLFFSQLGTFDIKDLICYLFVVLFFLYKPLN